MPMREAAPRPMKKPSEKLNAPGGKSNAMCAIEVQRAGDDHGERRSTSVPTQSDTVIFAIDVMRRYSSTMLRMPTTAVTSETGPRRQARPDVAEVLREADVARRDLERPAEDELPDEQERHQASERLAAEGLAQIDERSARSRHRRAELAPDHAVADDDHERDDPAEHRLRAAERRHEQRDRDERPDADHVGHVQRRRLKQTESSRRCAGHFD